MRNYRNALAALVFALALSAPAFADDGVMTTDKTGSTPPPPSAVSTAQASPSDGIIHTDVAAPAPQTADSLAEAALSLLQALALI
jgi:hypothetical protein